MAHDAAEADGGDQEGGVAGPGDAEFEIYPWEPPSVQLAVEIQTGPWGEAFDEILRWHEAEERKEAEAKAEQAGGGLFDFDDLPQPEPRKIEAPARIAPRSRRGPLRFAERAAEQALEDCERSRTVRTARQQIQDALEQQLKAIPLGDIRRRHLREKAKEDTARAPPDPPPSRQQAREWARQLCTLQRDPEENPLPGATPEGYRQEVPKSVEILEPEAIEILKKRADVNHQVGDLKRYPLHMAAERCYPQLIAELLKARADPNKADFSGETPLHTVGHSGGWCEAPPAQRRLAVERLVEGRADLSFANPRGRTPLHIAASAGDGTIMAALVREMADVNAADLGGFTPLMWAAGHGRADAVQSLLDAEADMNLQANRGQTAMLFALTNKKTLVVEALEGHLAIKDKQEEWRKALRQEGENANSGQGQKAGAGGGKREGEEVAEETKPAKATMYFPYMGKVREEYAPSLTSNVY
mmetsp:Transcript_80230/g.250102  ORF Transcript_80230/g.250102 Transcript_80230/m.250102 type:complete len:472 (+) Transcript_80230:61-1476(+)